MRQRVSLHISAFPNPCKLGHADIKTTLGIYSHVIPSLHKDVAKIKESLQHKE